MTLLRWIPLLALCSSLAAAATTAAPEPTAEETAVLLRLDQHRASWWDGDERIADAIRAQEITATTDHWTRARLGKGHAPPLVFDRALNAAAHALLKQRLQAADKKRTDAAAALGAAGYAPEQPNLVLVAYDQPTLAIAYATAMTNVIGETVSYQTVMRPLFAGTEALKPEFRQAGVAVAAQGGKLSLVIVLGAGSAKRYAGGVAYGDANHDGRYSPGEGRAGVQVACGAAKTTTGPSGTWSLALDSEDEAELTLTCEQQTLARRLAKSADTEAVSWRIPDQADLRAVDKLLADAQQAAAGKDRERARVAQANLLAGTRLAIVDEARQQRIAAAVEPVQEAFAETLGEIRSALAEEPAVFKKRFEAAKKPWKGAMAAWFKEAETLAAVRAQVNAFASTRAEQQGKLRPAVVKLLTKCLAETTDAAFLEQYLVWLGLVDRQLAEAIGAKDPVP